MSDVYVNSYYVDSMEQTKNTSLLLLIVLLLILRAVISYH